MFKYRVPAKSIMEGKQPWRLHQAAFDMFFCDQFPGPTCAVSILEAAVLGSSLFGCVGHRARRLHMGLAQNDQRNNIFRHS